MGVFDLRKSYSGIAFWIRNTRGFLQMALATISELQYFWAENAWLRTKRCAYTSVYCNQKSRTNVAFSDWTKLCERATIPVSEDFSKEKSEYILIPVYLKTDKSNVYSESGLAFRNRISANRTQS